MYVVQIALGIYALRAFEEVDEGGYAVTLGLAPQWRFLGLASQWRSTQLCASSPYGIRRDRTAAPPAKALHAGPWNKFEVE